MPATERWLVRKPAPSGLVVGLLTLTLLLRTTPARADGTFPEPRQILLPADRPQQIILGTNFGLIISEDGGKTWLFSCERGLSNYAGPYLLGAQTPHRIFALTSGAGLIHSDDDSCSWQAAGTSSDLLLFSVAVDRANSQRVYTTGAPRNDLRNGQSIYVSDDGGLSLGKTVFTSPAGSAVLSVMVAPSRPSRLFATMFSTPENHPMVLRSDDSGEHWDVAADAVESLGENPFELLAIDAQDENRLYVRILGASAETLAMSADGGQSFVQSASISGKLNAFIKLASGTIIVAGTAGIDAVGYRSKDDGQTFEAWPEAPHGHALAERSGKLYIAGDGYADGYAIAESDDEGDHVTPLAGFSQVQAVKSCVADLCTDACAYYSGVGLWPQAVCGAISMQPLPDGSAGAGGATDTGGATGTGGTTGMSAGAGAVPNAMAGNGQQPEPGAATAGSPDRGETHDHPRLHVSGGGCACGLVGERPGDSSLALLVAALTWATVRRAARAGRVTDSRTRMRRRGRR